MTEHPIDRQIDTVLTLTLRDCDRAQLLFRSLKLLEPLRVCWVVAPDAELVHVRHHVDDLHRLREMAA